jgi:hypothetical protein
MKSMEREKRSRRGKELRATDFGQSFNRQRRMRLLQEGTAWECRAQRIRRVSLDGWLRHSAGGCGSSLVLGHDNDL